MDPRTTRATFAIEGLDDILRGGLVRGRTYLVKGRPGAGKTTLALQFLLSGVARGERALYIGLSETAEELQGVADSHGWSLEGISLFELKVDTQPLGGAGYSMYEPAEIELNEVIRGLLEQVERIKPDRVVLDSLSEIRLLAQQPLRYRRQLLALKQYFAGTSTTVLLVDDDCAGATEQLESLVHGIIALERRSPIYGGSRRRLEVVKFRGLGYRDGFHDYAIVRGGVRVFPRLVAAEHRLHHERDTVASGVAALDSLLGGGLDRGTATLVLGPVGAGKSALAAQYAASVAGRGERVALFTFDENISTLYARSDALGMPLRRLAEEKVAHVQQIDPAEMSPGQLTHEVRREVEARGARLVVLDSLTGYLNAMPEEQYLLNQLHELLAYLNQNGVVTLLVATQHGVIGGTSNAIDASYLADTVILLRYYEARGSVRNAISVVKKRTGAHERTIREFALSSGGMVIGAPLRDLHGVLTGTPIFTGSSETVRGPSA